MKYCADITLNDDQIFRFKTLCGEIFNDKCVEWPKCKTKKGYGIYQVGGRPRLAHRVSYLIFKGDLDNKLIIDHICRNRSCINPDHLRQVTHRENNLNNGAANYVVNGVKTRCIHGHEFTYANTYIRKGLKNGRESRVCKKCNTQRQLKFIKKKKLLTT